MTDIDCDRIKEIEDRFACGWRLIEDLNWLLHKVKELSDDKQSGCGSTSSTSETQSKTVYI